MAKPGTGILPPLLVYPTPSAPPVTPWALVGGISVMIAGGLLAPARWWIYVPLGIVTGALIQHPSVRTAVHNALAQRGL